MADEWYIDVGGVVEGPLSVAELCDRAASGQLRPTDGVSADRVTWVPANTLTDLQFRARPRQPLLETVVSGSVHITPPGAPSASDPPEIEGYELDPKPLGVGACGVVYRARQKNLGRVVALKTVSMGKNASPELAARFEQEARSLAGLQHPHVVAVYDSGQCVRPPAQAYYAMELLDGEDLAARVERAGPLDERTAWLIARQTASALAHAAKHGIIHRDVKPANLFLVAPPTGFPLPPDVPMVKVTDFGLALTRGEAELSQFQTTAGTLLGTPVYMAPEQFTASNVDLRADIYSLGATVHHVLTGHAPFDGRTVWEVMMKKAGGPVRLGPPVSRESADLVAAMMAVKPNDRPGDYVALIERIDALPCLEGVFGVSGILGLSGRMRAALLPPPPPPPPARPAPPRSARGIYLLAAVGFLALGTGIAALAGAFHRPAAPSEKQSEPPSAKHATYVTGAHESLYRSGSLIGWQPAGGSWTIAEDEVEKTEVIAGTGVAVRPFNPKAAFRITLGIDPHQAKTVEVQIAATAGPASDARWLIRLDRTEGVALGKRVGAGAFEPLGAAVRLPTPDELAARSKRPYLEVKYERAGGQLTAWFCTQRLGEIPDAGLKTTEFRVQATDGPVRIDYASFEELIEQR